MATIELKEINMPSIKMPEINTDFAKAAKDIAAVAKDATYVVIGAGVLGFQQAQVQRQELIKRLAEPKAGIEDRVNCGPLRPERRPPRASTPPSKG